MTYKPLPPRAHLKARLSYDPLTGLLTWRKRRGNTVTNRRWNGKFAGTTAGRRPARAPRYITVMVDGISYMAHRIIYKMHHGAEPPLVDHRNGNKLDNRIGNLRAANKALNGANSKDRARDLPRGVFRCQKSSVNPFRAQIRNVHLGVFPTIKAASAAFRAAARAEYGEFASA